MSASPKPPSNVPPLGFGTYRISDENPDHLETLRYALMRGVRLIDTSTNYGDGAAERAVGKVMPAFLATGRADRSDFTLVTKAGYLQGSNLDRAEARARQGRPYSEVTKLTETLSHCIAPEFLADQITESIARLEGVGIDTLLLHNPEYFLKESPDHREYYRRIEAAFRHLEKECDQGRIRSYGVSSNTFIEPREHPEYTSLELCLEIAEKIAHETGRPHRFNTVQFPLNLFETGAAQLSNNGADTVLELCERKGLTTLANRPLNAFTAKHLMRLANYRHRHGIDLDSAIQKTLELTVRLESEFPRGLLSHEHRLYWGHVLKDQLRHLVDLEQWRQIEAFRIRPELVHLQEDAKLHPQIRAWWEKYEPAMEATLLAISAWLENEAAMRSERLKAQLTEAVPALRGMTTLSGVALRIYRSIPGLSYVLLGMRKNTYVDDAMIALGLKPLTAEEAFSALDSAAAFLEEYETTPTKEENP